jgi:uncharacterized integral membrane protein
VAESPEQQGWHELPKQRRKVSPELIFALVIAILLVVFIVQNSDDANVTWIFTDTDTPLWVVIFVSAVAGYIVGRLIEFGLRRRLRSRQRD